MNFAVLYPLAWLGAIAVGVPIWLHLRRKEPSHIVRFSAMRFLEDQPLARQSPLLPRQWPLLLLRMLFVLLVAGAFSWPYLRNDDATAIRESRAYIVDDTMSNQASGRWAASRQYLLDELRAAGPDVEIAVIELKATPNAVAVFTDDRATAASAVADLQPSHQRGSYLNAFRMASRLLEKARGGHRQIVLLGDSQANQWSGETTSAPFLDGIDVKLPDVESPALANVGLVRPRVTRISRESESFVECAVTVVRVGDLARTAVTYWVDGAEVSRTEASFSEGSGSIQTSTVWKDDGDGWLTGEIRIEDASDALAADDRVYFALPPPTRGRIALLADSRYLRTALAQDIMPDRWTVHEVPSAADGAVSVPEGPVDAICLEARHLRSRPVREWVNDSLKHGVGVLLLVDAASDFIAGHLDQYGIELQRGGAHRGPAEPLRYVFLDHPVFRPFRSPDYGNLARIKVGRYRRLTVDDALPLAYSSSGDPLIFASNTGNGRMVVLAFELDRRETNWPLDPTFVPFLDRALTHVKREGDAPETAFQPASIVTWRLPPGHGGDDIVLRSAGSDADALAGRATVVDGAARIVAPDRPGLYVLQCNNDEGARRVICVNPVPEESDLRFADSPSVLRDWQAGETDRTFVGEAPAAVTDVSRSEILRQRIWWWLIAAGTMAVLMETLWVSLQRAPA